MPTEWRAFNTRCCVKIDGIIYPVPVYQLTIRMVPRLDGGPSFVTDISGTRRVNWKTRQYYLDSECIWDELGMQSPEYYKLVAAIFKHNGVNDIYFCPTYPFAPPYQILSIVDMADDMLVVPWRDQMRGEPGRIRFLGTNPSDSIGEIMLIIGDTGFIDDEEEGEVPFVPGESDAVTLRVISVGDGEVVLGWTAYGLADGYNLYYDTDSGEPYANTVNIPLANLDDPSDPTYLVDGLSNGQTYYFAVKAYFD